MFPGLYEVIDARKMPPELKLSPVAMLSTVPGEVVVWMCTGKSTSFELKDNYDWNEDHGLTIYTDKGMISFVPLDPGADVLAFVDTPFDGLVQDCLR
jgi:hypothetical protein